MIKRAAAALIGLLLLALALINVGGTVDPISISLLLVPAFIVAGLCLWYAVSAGNPQSKRRIACAFKAGLITGLLIFTVFFIGPIIVMPEANQGPILGFLSAPLGFALGAIIGACFPGLCGRFKAWGT